MNRSTFLKTILGLVTAPFAVANIPGKKQDIECTVDGYISNYGKPIQQQNTIDLLINSVHKYGNITHYNEPVTYALWGKSIKYDMWFNEKKYFSKTHIFLNKYRFEFDTYLKKEPTSVKLFLGENGYYSLIDGVRYNPCVQCETYSNYSSMELTQI